MLTNDEIEQMKGVVRKCIYGIPDSEGQVARDTLDKIVAELLTLREAVSPQMAEVDALQDPWVGQPFVEIIGTFRNMRYLTRTAILACEREKQRADEADARYDRFVSEWFEEDADYQRLVDVAESHIDPDCWLAKECQRIHEIFLKRFEEEQQIEEEQQND